MSASVRTALDQVEITPADTAVVELAQRYAEQIDAGPETDDKGNVRDPLATLGPKLLACLVELRLTPKARSAVVKGGNSDRVESPLDQLKARRAARQHDAAAVDS